MAGWGNMPVATACAIVTRLPNRPNGTMHYPNERSFFVSPPPLLGGPMWILSKHLKLSHAHSELETLILERTAELQKLSQRLLKVQDEERRKIARDLHDSTGQTLTALKISVSLLQEDCKAEPARLAILSDVEIGRASCRERVEISVVA